MTNDEFRAFFEKLQSGSDLRATEKKNTKQVISEGLGQYTAPLPSERTKDYSHGAAYNVPIEQHREMAQQRQEETTPAWNPDEARAWERGAHRVGSFMENYGKFADPTRSAIGPIGKAVRQYVESDQPRKLEERAGRAAGRQQLKEDSSSYQQELASQGGVLGIMRDQFTGRRGQEDADALLAAQRDIRDSSIEARPSTLGFQETYTKGAKSIHNRLEASARERLDEPSEEGEQTILDRVRDSRSYSRGETAGNIAYTVQNYWFASQILGLAGISKAILGKLAPAVGQTKGSFMAAQGTALAIDVIARTPGEVIEKIENDESLGEFGKRWAKARAWDVVFNLAIGGVMDFRKIRKSLKIEDAANHVLQKARASGMKEELLQRKYREAMKIAKGKAGHYGSEADWRRLAVENQNIAERIMKQEMDAYVMGARGTRNLKAPRQSVIEGYVPGRNSNLDAYVNRMQAEAQLVDTLNPNQIEVWAEASLQRKTVPEIYQQYNKELAQKMAKNADQKTLKPLQDKLEVIESVWNKQRSIEADLGVDIFTPPTDLRRSIVEVPQIQGTPPPAPLSETGQKAAQQMNPSRSNLGLADGQPAPAGAWEVATQNPTASNAGASSDLLDEESIIKTVKAMRSKAGAPAEGILDRVITSKVGRENKAEARLLNLFLDKASEVKSITKANRRIISMTPKGPVQLKKPTLELVMENGATREVNLETANDILPTEKYTKNVWRLVRKVFGKDSEGVMRHLTGEKYQQAVVTDQQLKAFVSSKLDSWRTVANKGRVGRKPTKQEVSFFGDVQKYMENAEAPSALLKKWGDADYKKLVSIAEDMTTTYENMRIMHNGYTAMLPGNGGKFADFAILDQKRMMWDIQLTKVERELLEAKARTGPKASAQIKQLEAKAKTLQNYLEDTGDEYIKLARAGDSGRYTFIPHRHSYAYHFDSTGTAMRSESVSMGSEVGRRSSEGILSLDRTAKGGRFMQARGSREGLFKYDALEGFARYGDEMTAVIAWDDYVKSIDGLHHQIAEQAPHLKNFGSFLEIYAKDLRAQPIGLDAIISEAKSPFLQKLFGGAAEFSTVQKLNIAGGNLGMMLSQFSALAPATQALGAKNMMVGSSYAMGEVAESFIKNNPNAATSKKLQTAFGEFLELKGKMNAQTTRQNAQQMHQYSAHALMNQSYPVSRGRAIMDNVSIVGDSKLRRGTEWMYKPVKFGDDVTGRMIYNGAVLRATEQFDEVLKAIPSKQLAQYSPEQIYKLKQEFVGQHATEMFNTIIGGRTKGTTALMYRQRSVQSFIPFMLEAHNYLQYVGDTISERNVVEIAKLMFYTHLFNEGVKSVRGTKVAFDPIDAGKEIHRNFKEDPEYTLYNAAGTMVAEILGGWPGGDYIAYSVNQLLGETEGLRTPMDRAFMGQRDPSRHGVEPLFIRTAKDLVGVAGSVAEFGQTGRVDLDPLLGLIPGGLQAEKVRGAAEALRQGGVTSRDDRMMMPIDQKNFLEMAQGLTFGRNAFSEMREYRQAYYQPLLTEPETVAFQELREKHDEMDLYQAIYLDKHIRSFSAKRDNLTKRAEDFRLETGLSSNRDVRDHAKMLESISEYEKALKRLEQERNQSLQRLGYKEMRQLSREIDRIWDRWKDTRERNLGEQEERLGESVTQSTDVGVRGSIERQLRSDSTLLDGIRARLGGQQ